MTAPCRVAVTGLGVLARAGIGRGGFCPGVLGGSRPPPRRWSSQASSAPTPTGSECGWEPAWAAFAPWKIKSRSA